MIVTTTHAPGTFCWPELSTSDQAGAEKFYGELFGWNLAKTPMGPDAHYTIFLKGENSVAAAAQQEPEQKQAGIPPHWLSYAATANVDESVEKAKSLGGTVIAGPFDVMEYGRMVVLADPTGAAFALWQANKNPGATAIDEDNTLVWTELVTDNVDKARGFYEGLFGWRSEPYPGPMPYTVFKRGPVSAGGLMAKTPEMGPNVPNHWMPYFGVADTKASLKKAAALGATIVVDAMEVPGVGIMGVVRDPQGAHFSIMQMTEMPKG
jgi:predicted enzyme related to lactoylglutathione lyase